ncbi:MAG: glutamine--tRNA ligase/YqeY domain fusion protein [Eubacteriaceae bacterium]|nr:glutamine--tRNA ligase/YqeY domain fusion protein [Eubacteriaceae bacterium]
MSEPKSNFIYSEIENDIKNGVYEQAKLITRFPPEPNGYLHIGHAKAIYISFSVREKYGGQTNLRFDDTNPAKEEQEFAESQIEDIKWLGYDWDNLFYASSYFGKMYEYAHELIAKGLAYIDDQSPDEIKLTRGSLTKPGVPSPYRDRSIEENAELFTAMKDGKFKAGERVLRAKIDMSSPNMNMRDPVMYRILHETHHMTGDEWCIYPMYDYAHPIEDAIENITHSLCSLEYEDHRPLYEWVLNNLDDYKENQPRQIEFARLAIENALTSKRYIKMLVDQGIVDGWDDPRLFTLRGIRRRGITPAALRRFCEEVGVAKSNSIVPRAQLDYFVREDLQKISPKAMAVIEPIRLVIENYPEGEHEILKIANDDGTERDVPFGRELYIEAEDFEIEPPPKYRRLYIGNEVRLIGAYIIKCTGYSIDENGGMSVQAVYDPETKSGTGSAKKAKGTIHWVHAPSAVAITTRGFTDLYNASAPGEGILDKINKDSIIEKTSYAEPAVGATEPSGRWQFLRKGFYVLDSKLSSGENLVFNMTVSLKSSWKPEA